MAATYEAVLGLTEGSLVAVTAGMRRAFGTGSPQRESGPPAELSDKKLDTLIDLAERGNATGAHWLQIAGQLGQYERVFLRKHEWTMLCEQLVLELGTAVGFGYVRRYETAAALMRQPNARRHLTRALGAFVTHPDVQVITPVLALLSEARDPAANDLVLRLLHAESKSFRSAAAMVAAVKVARGHFPPESMNDLESHVVGSLRRGESLDGRLDSFDLAVHLPDESWDRAKGGLRNRRAYGLVTDARKGGEIVPSSQTSKIVNELSTRVQASTPTHHPHEPDAMLRRLLREALFHAHKARRHHAALLLAASPYAPAVSHHCHNLAGHSNDLIAARAWTLLMRVGSGPRRSRVLLNALAETRPTIRARALVNLGLSTGALATNEIGALMRKFDESNRVSDRQATLFALGMSGADELKLLAEHETEWIRRAAAWWLDQGPAIHDSDIRVLPDPVPRPDYRVAAQRGWRASCRLCATRRPAESQISQSSSNIPPARLRVSCRTLSQPGAGSARTCAVSSSVGAQPIIPSSKVTGGSASSTISSEIGSGSRPSTSRNHALSTPFPLGLPTAQPTWSGWKSISKRSISGANARTSAGAIEFGTHSSRGGRCGSTAVVRTSSPSRPRSPTVASAVIRVTPSWLRSTAAVARLPPSRRTSMLTVAGPGVEAER